MSLPNLRADAEAIFRAGLAAADPHRLLLERSSIEKDRWSYRDAERAVSWVLPPAGSGGRVLVVGAGKAAASLAVAVEDLLGDRIARGRIVVKHGHGLPLKRIAIEEGGHPLPDRGGLEGTARLLRDLADTRPDDRVFFLLTGGASALLVAPAPGLTLEDKIATTRLLLASGATIQEMNALRKHLSAVKGGCLAEHIHPAPAMTLIVSDVVGDDLTSIGSGPTAPDPTTYADCLQILRRYRLTDQVPTAVRQRLTAGAEGNIPETPKPGQPVFEGMRWLILASNRHSLDAASKASERLGYRPEIFAYDMVGDTHDRARAFASRLVGLTGLGPVALLAGGETTLSVRGQGKGGRNQEFALVAAREIEGRENVLVLAAGTDGTDGPTDAAGAFADGTTYARAEKKGLDPAASLRDNDSYTLFDALGDLLRSGPTGTNVMDLVVGLAR
ncbi:MAG: glycerate kinase type-2 family protein [Vicinamibacteria bacterium]